MFMKDAGWTVFGPMTTPALINIYHNLLDQLSRTKFRKMDKKMGKIWPKTDKTLGMIMLAVGVFCTSTDQTKQPHN